MNDMLKDLQAYFDNTPREQVLKDWAENKEDTRGIKSPTIGEFMATQRFWSDKLHLPEPNPRSKHIVRVIPANEILENRSSAYKFINFFDSDTINTEQSKGC